MIDYSENKEDIKLILNQFCNFIACVSDDKQPASKLIDQFVDDHIAMDEGMKGWMNYEKERHEKNQAILKAVKKEKGNTFYKYLIEVIMDCLDIGDIEIVDKPQGTFKKETECGRTINGTWVDQRAEGMEGDSWSGSVCVLLSADRYLRFTYTC